MNIDKCENCFEKGSILYQSQTFPLIIRFWHFVNYLYFLARITDEVRRMYGKDLCFSKWENERYVRKIKSQ